MIREEDFRYIFEQVLSMSSDGFILTDQNGIIEEINKPYADFFQKSREEIVGRPIRDLIPNTRSREILNGGEGEQNVIHVFEKGTTREEAAIVSRTAVHNEKGEAVAFVSQVRFQPDMMEMAGKFRDDRNELEYYREEQKESVGSMVGSSPAFREALRECVKAARTDFSVLITGETGTGKEAFARYLHNQSRRSGRPFVSINCGAIPADLLESELFGYAEGAFTGALRGGKKGKFQLADRGTIFLDEIGDMPIPLQVKLLRVLQEREVEPVGGDRPVPVDIRVVAATRRNLEQMVVEGSFREDLYYRLNVIRIALPPLRERGEDVLEIARHVLEELNAKYGTDKYLSREAEQAVLRNRWPGNVREVQNVIQSAFTLGEKKELTLEDFPARFATGAGQARGPAGESYLWGGKGQGEEGKKIYDLRPLREQVEDYERKVLQEILERCDYNYTRAAEAAGIHRSLLYKKMAKYRMKDHDKEKKGRP